MQCFLLLSKMLTPMYRYIAAFLQSCLVNYGAIKSATAVLDSSEKNVVFYGMYVVTPHLKRDRALRPSARSQRSATSLADSSF